MSSKKKILFVHPWLVEAGSQKYLFEILKHISRSTFEVGVLCGIQSPKADNVRPETYYSKIKDLDVPLYPLINLVANKAATPPPTHPLLQYAKDVLKHRFGIKLKAKKKQEESTSLKWLAACAEVMKQYDKIVFVDVYLFQSFAKTIEEIGVPFAFIVTGTSNQFENNYKHLPSGSNYDFVYFTEQIITDIQQHLPGNHRFLHLPLGTDNSIAKVKETTADTTLWNIGIFTRLHPSKHIEMFIQAFYELVTTVKDPSCFKLTIVGAEDDVHYVQTLKSFIQFMELTDYVVFAGHATHLTNTVEQHGINMGWFHTMHDTPGYVGIELCQAGLLGVFWNVSNPWSTRLHIAKEEEIYAHRSIAEFVNQTLLLTTDVAYRNKIYKAQATYFGTKHNMARSIHNFEEFMLS